MSLRDTYLTIRQLLGSDDRFYLEELEGYAEALFKNFAKFQPGARVRLTKDICGGSQREHGAYAGDPTLVIGAVGTVSTQDYDERHGFNYWVEFDRELWKDGAGMLHDKDRKHVYSILERDLEKVNDGIGR